VSRLREALALADALSGGGGPALVEPEDFRVAIQAMEDQSADQFPANCWVLYDGGGSPLCSGGTVISFATRGVAEAWARERDICVRPVPAQLTHTEQESIAPPTNLEISAIGASLHYLVRAGKVSEAVHDAVMRWLVASRATEEKSKC